MYLHWQAYLNIKGLEHTKTDWALAQITKILNESNGGKANPLNEYLIKFQTKEEADKARELMEDKIFDRIWKNANPNTRYIVENKV